MTDAKLTIRRVKGGALRAFIGDRLIAGVKSVQLECVGFGAACLVLKVSGNHVLLADDEPEPRA